MKKITSKLEIIQIQNELLTAACSEIFWKSAVTR